MNCDQYRKLYQQYSASGLSREIWETQQFGDWVDHFHTCQSCSDWDLGKRMETINHKVSDFPCVHVAYQVTQKCEKHSDPKDCPDILIVKFNGGYGIPIRDGGSSIVRINFAHGAEKSYTKSDLEDKGDIS